MKIIFVFAGMIITGFSSCRKLIAIPEARTQIPAESVFTDIKTANAAVLGLYSQMMNNVGNPENGGLSIYGGLLADDIISATQSSQFEPFQHNALNAEDYTIYGFWYSAFTNIYHANSIIEKLKGTRGWMRLKKYNLIGEAKIVRCFYYFYLINLFGDVPLVTTVDYRVTSILPRTPVAEIYKFLTEDLSDAEILLRADYSSIDRFRPCALVATATTRQSPFV